MTKGQPTWSILKNSTGPGTTMVEARNESCFPNNASFTDLSTSFSKIAANGRATVKSKNLRNISSAKWTERPPFIPRSFLDNERKMRQIVHLFEALHISSTKDEKKKKKNKLNVTLLTNYETGQLNSTLVIKIIKGIFGGLLSEKGQTGTGVCSQIKGSSSTVTNCLSTASMRQLIKPQ